MLGNIIGYVVDGKNRVRTSEEETLSISFTSIFPETTFRDSIALSTFNVEGFGLSGFCFLKLLASGFGTSCCFACSAIFEAECCRVLVSFVLGMDGVGVAWSDVFEGVSPRSSADCFSSTFEARKNESLFSILSIVLLTAELNDAGSGEDGGPEGGRTFTSLLPLGVSSLFVSRRPKKELFVLSTDTMFCAPTISKRATFAKINKSPNKNTIIMRR
mmetsp:Transcript_26703/g.68618  ORF Transcript_26703/g.68618 Transcript_26703/m.68618 type:complete len:216 (+) Transcript_26703:1911-2558(+)